MRRWRICRLAAAFENLDDDHAAAAAGARAGQDARLVRGSGLLLLLVNDGRGSTEQLACTCDVGGAVAAGKQAIVADAVEAFRQDVGEESNRCGNPSSGKRRGCRRWRPDDDWRWRHGGYTAIGSAVPAWARRTGSWCRR